MRRRSFLALLAALAPLAALAASAQPFAGQPFQSALQAGQPVLVEIHAGWCPTCRAQAPIVDKLTAQPPYAGIARFRVDFDSQPEVVKRFRARYQSTLILFKGGTEVARSVGVTSEPDIRAMLDKAR
jgi:thioredoxin 1